MEKFNLSNPKLRLKFELIIRNLFTLYTFIEKNVAGKRTIRDTATKDVTV